MREFFVVATPIGNLSDITLRALETLKNCDAILCEDSRITSRLLSKYEIKNKKLVVYNDNSDAKNRDAILRMINSGLKLALVSDAGTPLISDPGHKLLQILRQNAVKITPIVGASSLIAALSACALAVDNFLFVGFSPSAKIQRENFLKNLPKDYSIVFFESPNRLIESLKNVAEIFHNPRICVARELTKIHEEITTDKALSVLEFFENNPDKIRGEIVIIIEKSEKSVISQEELAVEIKKLLALGMSLKDVSRDLAELYGFNKKEVYELALKLKS